MASHSLHEGRLGTLTTLDLENRWLKVRLLPEIGAKIYDLIWKPTGKNFLWHNPRIAPQVYPIEADFDNYWCGGWDDAFPTCDECVFRGQRYPSLGEMRSLRWNVDSVGRRGKDVEAQLSAYGPISPVKAVKTVTVEALSPVVRIQYQITNLWLWLNYGGWRGLHHVIVEPWTSVPVNLTQAYEQKTSRSLKPGEEFSVEVSATVYHKPETWRGALGRLR